MNLSQNETLTEIKADVPRAKLEGLQEAVTHIDLQMLQVRNGIEQKKGIVQAAGVISKRVFQECAPINQAVEAGELEPEIAKLRIAEVSRITEIIRGIERDNRNDLIEMQGQLKGLERAANAIAGHFKSEAQKYERYQRMEDEDDDDLGRSAASSDLDEEEKHEGGNGSKPPKKTKAATKKSKRKS
jgi:hypothetical protein